ncbi:MAG TPA: class I SAM-dependent methyltransferase, partial [Burkholderiaceae bacterium]|nr:class I SAM-dependent methyltransferase [Burkholderiaceae bacterium]
SGGRLLHAEVVDHYFGVPGSWNLKRCDNGACGLIWQDPMVIGEDLPRAYREYYTTTATNAEGVSSEVPFEATFYRLERLAARILRLADERRRFALAYLDHRRPGKLLDVGCGTGAFVAAMQRLGWEARGTDFDPIAAERARTIHNISVDVGDLIQLRYEAESLDAIALRHVIEHVYEPRELVAECWRLLKPGGQLVFATPNAASLGHQHFGPRWRGLEQPRHLYLYDPRSMLALLERAGISNAQVFSSAQGAAYGLRGSFATSRGVVRRCVDYAAIWWLQIAETLLTRHGREVGEELIAIVRKPSADEEKTPAREPQTKMSFVKRSDQASAT